jgi:hypothetical protein
MSRTGRDRGTYEPRVDVGGTLTLGTLLDAERDLTARIERAREQARATVESAHADAATMDAAAADELARELARLDDAHGVETEAAIDALTVAAAEDAARFDATGEATVQALADAVIEDFLGVSSFSGERATS